MGTHLPLETLAIVPRRLPSLIRRRLSSPLVLPLCAVLLVEPSKPSVSASSTRRIRPSLLHHS
ncbi:hypothetical protein IC582_013841 [Cucumis melo]